MKFDMAKSSGQEHFVSIDTNLLGLVVGNTFPELQIEPPRNFDELFRRAKFEWLERMYGKDSFVMELLKRYEKKDAILEFASKIFALGSRFRNLLSDRGFRLNDVNFAIFSIKTVVAGYDSQRFLDKMVETFKYYIGNQVNSRTIIVIDEFPAFKNDVFGEILSISRESEVGCILISQSASGISRDPIDRHKLITYPHVKILLKSDYPEDMVNVAGTVKAYEKGVQFSGESEDVTGLGTRRIQDQFQIDPNEVRQLQAGCGFVISSGQSCKIQFGYIGDIEIDEKAIDTQYDLWRLADEKSSVPGSLYGDDVESLFSE